MYQLQLDNTNTGRQTFWKNREVLGEELGLYYINLLMVAKYVGKDLFEIKEVLKYRSGVELWSIMKS